MRKETRDLVCAHPEMVSHIPEALTFLVTADNIEDNVLEVCDCFNWAFPVSMTGPRYTRFSCRNMLFHLSFLILLVLTNGVMCFS